MLECVITGISQELDFENNVTVTYLSLRLPNGALLRTSVDEVAAATIVEMQVKAKGAPTPAVKPGPAIRPPAAPASEDVDDNNSDEFTAPGDDEFVRTESEDGSTTHVFGGQAAGDDDDEPADPPLPPPVPPTPPPPPPPPAAPVQTPNSLTKPRVAKGEKPARVSARARTVPAGDKGYPVVPNAGVDTDTFTGGRDRDEDGVGSI
jgi:hypothetical protein